MKRRETGVKISKSPPRGAVLRKACPESGVRLDQIWDDLELSKSGSKICQPMGLPYAKYQRKQATRWQSARRRGRGAWTTDTHGTLARSSTCGLDCRL